MNRALASSAKPNAHVEVFDTQGEDYRLPIIDCRLPITDYRLLILVTGSKEEKVIALLLSDGHPSPLGEGPGVRASKVQTQNTEYQTPKKL